MLTLKGENINLRALEPEDLDFLFEVENTEDNWEISTTSTPYSRYILKQYLDNSHKDIYEAKQLRLMICKNREDRVGLIDIFDFEPKHRRAAVGILICGKENRQNGYGTQALELVKKYCFSHLGLHQLYAGVGMDNLPSRKLFEKGGFLQTGIKRDWNYVNGKYKDELVYQLIRNVH